MATDHGADNEDRLRRESETLEVALKSIGDAVLVTDTAGRVTFLNAVAERLTGWPLSAARGEPFEKIFHIVNEFSGKPVEHPVAKVLESGGIVGLANHTVLIARDGRRVPVDDSGAPVRLANGELIGIVVVCRDVTERKRAEHMRAWLAAIIDSSDDAIASKTLDGIVTSWNPGATRLFGYQPAEIIGKPITTIIPPELHAEEADILARLRRGERIDHYETVRVAKDGRRIDISLTVSPMRGEDGEIMGASKVARDVTQRKRSEHRLREADRQKDEFLATLAHELRNPLAPICAAAELLKNAKSLAPELRAATTILERQARHMTHLVDDLLDISRITSGRIRLQPEPLELTELVKAVIESYRQSAETSRHQQIILTTASGPLHVIGDRIRLTQVFSNILHNALKYTPPGGRIDIALRTADGEAGVSIRDNGIGIPREMLEHIFEPFAQLDHSYERAEGGLGIGLTLAKRLVELHEGRIEARSEGGGKGTEILIHLPAVATPAQRTSAPQRESDASSSCRVLIADDNHDAAVSLSMLLQWMGHDTRVVHDGIEALEEAAHFHPDVVLLDIGMPRLDGYETARRLAGQPWAAATQIVAVTGRGQDTDRQRAKAAGFHRHLVKPVDLDVLREVLAVACESWSDPASR